ncbi:MAG TPA: NUDIX domain-containing protein [Anaerolineales bacterium]|nr:NUDIX domain-containing protein [Anaerolineales bacterium]
MPASDQGLDQQRYTVVPRTLIFLRRDDKVLLLRGAPHKRLWANRYNGIGGHVERGEDILSAARRELREEAGLEPAQLELCGVLSVDAGPDTGVIVFILTGELPQGEPLASSEGTAEWLAVDALGDLPLVEDLHILLPRSLAQAPGDPPFFARSYYDEQGKLQVVINDTSR